MTVRRSIPCPTVAGAALVLLALPVRADPAFAEVAAAVNAKTVKLFGSGGFQGLAAYGSGFLVSDDGYILTVASYILDTRDLRVHLADGRRYSPVQGVAVEPAPGLAGGQM